MSFAPQRRALFRHPNLQKWHEHVVFCTFWLGNVLRATTACTFSTSELPKVVCFVHFDLEMCFAPQRRALFRHLNFQKWSDNGVFCAFWLGNVLRATTACTFPTSQLPKVVRSWGVFYILTCKCASRHNGVHFSQLPKVVRHWCVLYILTSKCASRHNGVQFFITYLASWLRTRRFSEPTFRPSECFATFLPFRASPSSFLLIFLFSLPLSCSAFHLSILSEVWLLNFLR